MFEYFSEFSRARRKVIKARSKLLLECSRQLDGAGVMRRLRTVPVQAYAGKCGIENVDRDGFGDNQLIVFNPRWVVRNDFDSVVSALYRAYF